MEYVQGESLYRAFQILHGQGQRLPIRIATSILSGTLQGLHAAHEARDERAISLQIVHRDISPQNILIGVDGMARVLDFGIAKASSRIQFTRDGQLKGKVAYMAPEQLMHEAVSRATDIYSTGIVLWEALSGGKLFKGGLEAILAERIANPSVPSPRAIVPEIPPELEAVVMRALAHQPRDRFATAKDMAHALEKAVPPASLAEVNEWLESFAQGTLEERAQQVAAIECETPSPVATVSEMLQQISPELADGPSRHLYAAPAPASGMLYDTESVVVRPVDGKSFSPYTPDRSQSVALASTEIARRSPESQTAYRIIIGALITALLGTIAALVVRRSEPVAPVSMASSTVSLPSVIREDASATAVPQASLDVVPGASQAVPSDASVAHAEPSSKAAPKRQRPIMQVKTKTSAIPAPSLSPYDIIGGRN